MNEETKKLNSWEVFGKFLLSSVYLPIYLWVQGFVIASLWNWHLVSIINIRQVTILEGIGLNLAIAVITDQLGAGELVKEEFLVSKKKRYFIGWFYFITIYCLGWLLHLIQGSV